MQVTFPRQLIQPGRELIRCHTGTGEKAVRVEHNIETMERPRLISQRQRGSRVVHTRVQVCEAIDRSTVLISKERGKMFEFVRER